MDGALGALDSLAGVPLDQALDRTGVGLVACDERGRLTLLSPTLQELFGVAFEPLSEEVHLEQIGLWRADGVTELPAEERPLVVARRGEFVRDAVVSARSAEGRLIRLRCNAVPLRDGDGSDIGAIALVQDVTAETEAARAAEELRALLVETINHEFRTPLAALLGHVELIRDHRDDLDTELRGWLDAIERAGWRLRDLVREVNQLIEKQEGLRPGLEPAQPAQHAPSAQEHGSTPTGAAPSARFG